MDFYLLHEKHIINPTSKDFDYIIYIQGPHETYTFENIINIDNKKYCPHKIDQTLFNWNWNTGIWNENIDLITHENGLIATYEKISDYDNLELWQKKII